MAADYDFRRKPNEKGDGEVQPLYPRIVSKGTIDTAQLVRDIVRASSFTEGDLEGVIVSLEERISYYLSEGYHVQLGKMGYFSSTLKARPVMDKKEIRSVSISFDNINFRASMWFRRHSAGRLTRAKYGFAHSGDMPEEERRKRLEKYLEKNAFITRHDYTRLSGLLKGKALRELNALVHAKVLDTKGSGCHKVYVMAVNQNVMNDDR